MLPSFFDRLVSSCSSFFLESFNLISESRQSFVHAVSEVTISLFVKLAFSLARSEVSATDLEGVSKAPSEGSQREENSQERPENSRAE